MSVKLNLIAVLALVSSTFALAHASEFTTEVNYSLHTNEPKKVILSQDNKEENEKFEDAKDKSALPFLSAFVAGSSTKPDFEEVKDEKVDSGKNNDEKSAFLSSFKANDDLKEKNSKEEKDKKDENKNKLKPDGSKYSDSKVNYEDDEGKPALPSFFDVLVENYKKGNSELNEGEKVENYYVIEIKDDENSQSDYLIEEDIDGDDEDDDDAHDDGEDDEDDEEEVIINYGNDFREWFYYPSIFNFRSNVISIRRPIYRPYGPFRYPLIYSQYTNPYKLYGYRNRYLDIFKHGGLFDNVYDGDRYF